MIGVHADTEVLRAQGGFEPRRSEERLLPEVSVTFATDPVKIPYTLVFGTGTTGRFWANCGLSRLLNMKAGETFGNGNWSINSRKSRATQQCYCFVCVGSVVDLLTDEVKRRPEAEPIFSRSFWLLQHVMGCANCHRASFLKKIV